MRKKQTCGYVLLLKMHSSNNISKEGKRGREVTITENEGLIRQNEDTDDLIDGPFTKAELSCALRKTKMLLPVKDLICYVMTNQLSESSRIMLQDLYIQIWEKVKLPQVWKEAVVVPLHKRGEDCTIPGYRPIALYSICKIMAKIRNESKGNVLKYQSELEEVEIPWTLLYV